MSPINQGSYLPTSYYPIVSLINHILPRKKRKEINTKLFRICQQDLSFFLFSFRKTNRANFQGDLIVLGP